MSSNRAARWYIRSFVAAALAFPAAGLHPALAVSPPPVPVPSTSTQVGATVSTIPSGVSASARVGTQAAAPPPVTAASATVGAQAHAAVPAAPAPVAAPPVALPPVSVNVGAQAGAGASTGSLGTPPSLSADFGAQAAVSPPPGLPSVDVAVDPGVSLPPDQPAGSGSGPAATGAAAGSAPDPTLAARVMAAEFATAAVDSANPAGGDLAAGATGSSPTAAVKGTDRSALGQSPPAFCPQLAFGPMRTGCQGWLRPFAESGLAATGMPILLGLVGVLLTAVGAALYRRRSVRLTAASQG